MCSPIRRATSSASSAARSTDPGLRSYLVPRTSYRVPRTASPPEAAIVALCATGADTSDATMAADDPPSGIQRPPTVDISEPPTRRPRATVDGNRDTGDVSGHLRTKP